MRTAVVLLAMVALASMIGTLVQQNLPALTYQQVYGPFWYTLFDGLGLFDVFRAPWLFGVCGLLLVSVVVCLTRNGPQVWRQKYQKSKKMPPLPLGAVTQMLTSLPDLSRWRWHGETRQENKVITFYSRGGLNRIGYFAVHGGVVILAIGGLITGLFGYRATLNIRDGETDRYVIAFDGAEMTPHRLPFTVTNQDFTIEHYENGMPRQYRTQLSFADEQQTVVRDVAVNEPLQHQGFTFYQASFGDGGSSVVLTARHLASGAAIEISGQVYDTLPLAEGVTVELLDFRPHTILPLPQKQKSAGADFNDIGPSLDYIIRGPDFAPQQLRAYLNRPDIIGVALGENGSSEQVEYWPVYLGLSLDEAVGWAQLQQVQTALTEGKMDEVKHILAQAVAAYPPAERVGRAVKMVQAAPTILGFDMPYLVHVKDFQLRRYSGLQVVYDPGAWLFWLGSVLLTVGVVLMVQITHVRLWLVQEKTGYTLYLRSHRGRVYEEKVLAELVTA